MSEVSDDAIYRGFWINWSHGRTLGATLTTTSATANALIALLAVLVTLAVGHFWNLVLFLLHLSRAAEKHGDAIFQQEQVLLRSLPKPASIVTDTLKLLWAWRMTQNSRHMRRTIAILVLALIFFAGSIAASIFSSKVVQMADIEVLATGTNCILDIDADWGEYVDLLSTLVRSGQTYADSCYDSHGTSLGCKSFVQPRVEFSERHVPCPFPSSDFCMQSDPPALVLDSGLLDSNDIFGINDRPENRVFFRRQTTYVPVQVQNHFSVIDSPITSPVYPAFGEGQQAFAFNYGRVDMPEIPENTNITLIANTFFTNATKNYQLLPVVSYEYPELLPQRVCHLIPEISVPDADVGLLFMLPNNVCSSIPIEDPLFAAHRAVHCHDKNFYDCSDTASDKYNVTVYYPDYPAGLLVGIQQYQACLSDASGNPTHCTELGGSIYEQVEHFFPTANEAQLTTVDFLIYIGWFFDLYMVLTVPNSAVKASSTVFNGRQRGLPDNQWVTEALGLESWMWASVQEVISGHTTAWGLNITGTPGLLAPKTQAQQNLCHKQKVRKSGGFANINLFGFVFVITMSGFLMIADTCVLRVIIFLSRTRRALAPRVERWIQDGALQLQRRVYEDEGHGPWVRLHHEVPTYNGDKHLPTLYSPHHPGSSPSDSPLVGQTLSQQNLRHETPSEKNSHHGHESLRSASSIPHRSSIQHDPKTDTSRDGHFRNHHSSLSPDMSLQFQGYNQREFKHEIPQDATSFANPPISYQSYDSRRDFKYEIPDETENASRVISRASMV